MKAIQVHPLSATIGAFTAALLLFACSSSGSGASNSPGNPTPTPSTPGTPVSFYRDLTTATPSGSSNLPVTFQFGVMASETVITDISFSESTSVPASRLLVDGVPVYAWGYGGVNSVAGAVAPRFSLTHGILIPAGANVTVEAEPNCQFMALAGYASP